MSITEPSVVQKKQKPSEDPLSRKRNPRRPPKKFVTSHFVMVERPYDSQRNPQDITSIVKPAEWLKKESSRWVGRTGIYQNFNVPYLDFLGRSSGVTKYTWNTTPESYFMSYIANVAKLLIRYVDKSKVKKDDKWFLKHDSVFKIATIAILHRSDYVISRFVAVLKKPGARPVLKRIIRRFCSKMDDVTWFVYRHVSLQTKWLYPRSRSNEIRDKSRIKSSPSTSFRYERNDLVELRVKMFAFIQVRARLLSSLR